ncbi:unnamed protein product [Schistosoma curassoni]|uniref:Reverse transcriptase domain-containing protein n=1 Tax=Schistosoma curassoni TaxID=6186 RepID=A0A183JID6_9TREM|nr:unnamed protein product [Schistosoma curassoni]
MIRHIRAVGNTSIQCIASNAKLRHSGPINLNVLNDCLSSSAISKRNVHIQRQLCTSLGSFNDFFVNHRIHYFTQEFENFSETGLSILGLKLSKMFKMELALLVFNQNSDALLKDLIATCAKCTGGMKIQPIKLQQTCTSVEADDILNRLHGSKVFSKVDFKDDYLQVPLVQSSSILTTVNTPFGLFKYNFLPFGLSCSPAIFQEVMNKVACDLEGTDVYQNDLIVHGSDKVVHDDGLVVFLRHLIKKNITVNPNKYSFCIPSFEFIGCLVDGNGFRPDMKRLASLTNAPSSKNLTDVRSPVGILQYYSRLIPSCSCTNCLFNILTSNLFKWSEEQESCLRSLLKFLQNDAVLRT